MTEDLPWYLPWWTSCIIPIQDGRGLPNSEDVFHKMPRLAVGSSVRARTKYLYLISKLDCRGPYGGISTFPVAEISLGVTLRCATLRLNLVPGVTTAIMPIPWKV